MNKNKKIAIIGEILVEIMASQKNQTFSEQGQWLGPYASGAPAIFINQACKIGAKGMIWGSVGDDGFGTLCTTYLQKNGVITDAIKISQHQSTGVAFVRYEDDGSRSFIYHIDNAASGDISAEDIQETQLQDIGYFHVMGSSIFKEEMICVHEKIFAGLPADTVISLDPNIRVEILRKSPTLKRFIIDILKKAHIFFTTDEELQFLLEDNSIEGALATIWDSYSNVDYIIIKRAEKGASLYCRVGSSFEAHPITVDEVDPTGAGDSFAGAFIAAVSLGYSHAKALDIANIAGAHAVTKQGPMEGQTDMDGIQMYLNEKI